MHRRFHTAGTSTSFVLVAAPLSPLPVLFVLFTLWQRSNVEHHSELSQLERQGTIRSVIARIESEFGALGEGAQLGTLWISDDWIVTLDPNLYSRRSQRVIFELPRRLERYR